MQISLLTQAATRALNVFPDMNKFKRIPTFMERKPSYEFQKKNIEYIKKWREK
jgi:hypothetical protein